MCNAGSYDLRVGGYGSAGAGDFGFCSSSSGRGYDSSRNYSDKGEYSKPGEYR